MQWQLRRLKEISLNNNPSPWHQILNQNHRKIASLNCAGLLPHLKDLKVDPKLSDADLVALQEASLEEEHTIPHLNGYKIHVAGRGKGKGVATLAKDSLNWEVVQKVEGSIDLMRHSSATLDVINVYRHKNKSLVEASYSLNEVINIGKPTLVIGDFNVCARQNISNVITKSLTYLGFKQLVKEATQIEGNVIDHVYWRDGKNMWEDPIIEQYSPYYSDHDALLITLKLV